MISSAASLFSYSQTLDLGSSSVNPNSIKHPRDIDTSRRPRHPNFRPNSPPTGRQQHHPLIHIRQGSITTVDKKPHETAESCRLLLNSFLFSWTDRQTHTIITLFDQFLPSHSRMSWGPQRHPQANDAIELLNTVANESPTSSSNDIIRHSPGHDPPTLRQRPQQQQPLNRKKAEKRFWFIYSIAPPPTYSHNFAKNRPTATKF